MTKRSFFKFLDATDACYNQSPGSKFGGTSIREYQDGGLD